MLDLTSVENTISNMMALYGSLEPKEKEIEDEVIEEDNSSSYSFSISQSDVASLSALLN